MSVKLRNTNYELIRIIAMILIVIHHIFVHCINDQIMDPNICETSRMFNDYTIYKRLVITDYACAFGKIGNILFVMLSGYFLIDKKINISKQIIKILTEMLFATLLLMLASCITLHFERIKNPSNIRWFNDSWWFAGYYIFIVLVAWIGLNKSIHNMDKDKYKNILIVILAVMSIGWMRSIISKTGLDGIVSGVLLYLIGGYIRLYDPLKAVKKWFLLVILISAFLVMGISYYLYSSANINNAIVSGLDSYNQVIYGYSEYSITCLVSGIVLFEMIRRCRIHNSKIINFIASSTFIIYLIHDNGYMYGFFYKIKWVDIIYGREYLKFIVYLFSVVIIIFLLGIISYSIYKLTISLIKRQMNRFFIEDYKSESPS